MTVIRKLICALAALFIVSLPVNAAEAGPKLSPSIWEYTQKECQKQHADFALVLSIIEVESHGHAKSVSKSHCYGLMQISRSHRKALRKIGVKNLLEPKQNIRAGVHILHGIQKQNPGFSQMLMVYHYGKRGAQKLWHRGIYRTKYTRKVLRARRELISES